MGGVIEIPNPSEFDKSLTFTLLVVTTFLYVTGFMNLFIMITLLPSILNFSDLKQACLMTSAIEIRVYGFLSSILLSRSWISAGGCSPLDKAGNFRLGQDGTYLNADNKS